MLWWWDMAAGSYYHCYPVQLYPPAVWAPGVSRGGSPGLPEPTGEAHSHPVIRLWHSFRVAVLGPAVLRSQADKG